jgi:myosin-1
MLASNPVLEAFGNAKTVNNNNSSRFGKYMVILFDTRGDPVGGNVTNYLLEKSRVVGPSNNERNFHIFYQICAGMNDSQRNQFQVYSPDYYYYLFRSNCYEADGINDAQDFKETVEGMQQIGFSQEEINETFRLVSAILWLGNITFQEDASENSKIADPQVVDVIAGLLKIPAQSITKALCFRQIQTGTGKKTEVFSKPNNKVNAELTRDTLAKALYSRMFDWIVEKVNLSIRKPDHAGTLIGVLDIYGFEIFQFNSFEQICINFVNEKLQQIFIELTLKSEQEEYKNEGIPWSPVQYFDNKPCVSLIEEKPGVLTICDDACNTSKTDQMFIADLSNFFSGNRFIQCGNKDFSITHYAGRVRYEAEGFLEKNKDILFDDLIEMIQKSPNRFVKDHGWSSIVIEQGQKKRPPTVGSTFKKQVNSLVQALTSCVPHYIRCIKPNQTKKPNDFDSSYTKNQVTYLGLLENVRVRRAGYASRLTFERFVERYALLSQVVTDNPKGNPRQLVERIMQDIGFKPQENYAIGKTKVFIREASSLFHIEDLLDRKLNSAASSVQKMWNRYKKIKYFLRLKSNCHQVVKDRKERRRNSINKDYKGDYMDFSFNPIVKAVLQSSSVDEKLLFSDKVRSVLLKPKKGLFQSIFSKPEDISAPRFMILTNHAVYSFEFDADPETGKTRAKLFFRVSLDQIGSVTLSPLQDNYFVLHLSQAGASDSLQSCRHKTEFVGLLVESYKEKTGRSLQVNFLDTDNINFTKEGKPMQAVVKFMRDESAQEEKLKGGGNSFEVRIATGVNPREVPEPYRPPDVDPNALVRDQLKALYDFNGNGIDELTFKAGDVISVIDPESDGWYRGELRGKKGYVPGTYVTVIATAKRKGASPITGVVGAGSSNPTSFKSAQQNYSTVQANAAPKQYGAYGGASNSAAARGSVRNLVANAQASSGQNQPQAKVYGAYKPAAGAFKSIGGAGAEAAVSGAAAAKKGHGSAIAKPGANRFSGSGTFKAWEKVFDNESGQYYYFNKLTGQSTWDPPAGF